MKFILQGYTDNLLNNFGVRFNSFYSIFATTLGATKLTQNTRKRITKKSYSKVALCSVDDCNWVELNKG